MCTSCQGKCSPVYISVVRHKSVSFAFLLLITSQRKKMVDLYFKITNWWQAFESVVFGWITFCDSRKWKFLLYMQSNAINVIHCFIFSCMQPDSCVEVVAVGFYFKCKVTHLLSHSTSMGTIQWVIIVLVYSVNVCQMDSAFAAVERPGKGPPWGGKGKRKKQKHFDFLLQFHFHDWHLLARWPEKCQLLMEPEVAIVSFFLLTRTLRINCPSNNMR